MTRREVADELNTSLAYVHALANSGLLGLHDGETFDPVRIRDFKRYGTQWDESLGQRNRPATVPSPPGWEDTPDGFPGETIIGPAAILDPDLADQDEIWLAHFYMRPNPFFFPDPYLAGPIGALPIALKEACQLKSGERTVWLYPHPDGTLALAVATGRLEDVRDPIPEATDRIAPILDQLSYRYDHPLSVRQRLWIGVPSGIIRTEYTRRGPPTALDLEGFIEHEPLAEALSLYREGLIGHTPFHQFLCFWRARENVIKRRSEWCKSTNRSVPKVEREVFPDAPGFLKYRGCNFEDAKQGLERAFRVAIAHGTRKDGSPRILSRGADVEDVTRRVPLVRYVARTLIRNFEAALSAAIKGNPTHEG